MKALQLEAFDGPDALRVVELEEPALTADSVVIDVHSIGINYPDLLITKGLYQLKPPLPFVPGSEVAGRVRAAPPGSGFSEGDPVAAFVWTGGFAEQVVAPVNSVYLLPSGMDFSTGAATIMNYQTVHFALARRGRLARGEQLLVLGAGGGIGTAGVQVGKGLGAHVIAGVANEEQAAVAARAGADDVLVLEPGFSATVREMTGGRGVDLVLDPLGDWLFGEALRAIAPEGRILVVGFAAGQIPTVAVNRLLLKNISAVGVAWGAFLSVDPGIMASAGEEIADMYAQGTVRPLISSRYHFEQIPHALQELERGAILGKAIVDLADRD